MKKMKIRLEKVEILAKEKKDRTEESQSLRQ